MGGRVQNLKPWPKGISGNPGGRPKTTLITDELARLLEQEAPEAKDKTLATIIAEALLNQARRGDVKAIREVADRTEGRPRQQFNIDASATFSDGNPHCDVSRFTDEQLKHFLELLEVATPNEFTLQGNESGQRGNPKVSPGSEPPNQISDSDV